MNEWAGIPMPLADTRLVVEPTYPKAAELAAIGAGEVEKLDGVTIRNRFWSSRLRSEIVIWDESGKLQWGRLSSFNSLPFALSTLGCADAWGIEQEHNAIRTLGGMVSHRQLKQYLLTGMFLETSQRSKLTYLFRRLRPTVVLDARQKDATSTRVLAALCLHPIAYYEGSWAGAMCPTDDVIAHLALMRGDEVMFWRRANQHPPHRPEAGL